MCYKIGNVPELYMFFIYYFYPAFIYFFQMMEEFKGTGLVSVKVLKLR